MRLGRKRFGDAKKSGSLIEWKWAGVLTKELKYLVGVIYREPWKIITDYKCPLQDLRI